MYNLALEILVLEIEIVLIYKLSKKIISLLLNRKYRLRK